MKQESTKRAVAPSPQNSDSPPLAGGGRGRGSARVSAHAVEGEGQREALEVREGPVAPYLANPRPPRHSRAGGNPDWKLLRLGDISEGIQYGHTASAVQSGDGPRFLRITDIQNGQVDWSSVPGCDISSVEIAKYRLGSGDIVFARTGATTGKSFLISHCPDAVFASYLIRVRLKPEALPSFVYLYFQSPAYWRQIEAGKRGIGQPNVNGSVLSQIEIPLPPFAEQRRIVAALETQLTRLDASVTALKRVQANLKRYRASVLKAACEGHLVPIEAALARREGRSYESGVEFLERLIFKRRELWSGRGKYKVPTAPNVPKLNELPEGWIWASVEQLVVHVTDGDHQPPPQTAEGVPFLVIGNVRTGRIDLSDTRFVGNAYYESLDPMRQPKRGDLLYTLVGSYGIPAVVDTDKKFCIQRHMAILRPHQSSPIQYLAMAMASNLVFKQATMVATGTAQKTVPLAGLRRIAIPLPPLAEQHRIVAEVERRLSVIEELEATVAANLQRAERLRQSVLANAFSV